MTRRTAIRAQVLVGIETDRGPWVAALIAAGYHGVSRSTRCRRPSTASGTRCRAPRATRRDAHVLADMVRTDAHQLRPWPVTARRPKRSRW